MMMKNNAFVGLPVSEAAKAPWDTFAAEPRDAGWRNFDASLKGILTSGGYKTVLITDQTSCSSSLPVFCLHSFLCSVHIWHVHALFGDSLFML